MREEVSELEEAGISIVMICQGCFRDIISLRFTEKAFSDENYVQELLQSNDSIELYLGLWVQGFFEVEDAITSCQHLIEQGTRNQKLVVSYYNLALQRPEFTGKVANLVLETYPEDMELCAAFRPTYMPNLQNVIFRAIYGKRDGYYYGQETKYEYNPVSSELYFTGDAQAKEHFRLLMKLREAVPKKGHNYEPCIFPWYSVSILPSSMIEHMALIAYMVGEDAMIDEVCVLLPEMKNIYERRQVLRLLLHAPKTAIQRKALLDALADKSPDVRREAFSIVSELTLEEKDYGVIRGFLKYKAADIRKNVLALLETQTDEDLKQTISELLAEKKEESRLGGLDLVVRLKKDEKRQKLYKDCLIIVRGMENASEKETVIITELTGESQADSILKEEGYGLYNPQASCEIPESKGNPADFSNLIDMKEKKMNRLLQKLEAIFVENQDREYKNVYGVVLHIKRIFILQIKCG